MVDADAMGLWAKKNHSMPTVVDLTKSEADPLGRIDVGLCRVSQAIPVRQVGMPSGHQGCEEPVKPLQIHGFGNKNCAFGQVATGLDFFRGQG